MRRTAASPFARSSLALAALLLSGTAMAQSAPAPVAELVEQVAIPYDRFVLDNGLTVITHTDRKAPIVAVSIWYDVGSKHEPAGKTGYAHLFEHLMFNGSEHAPGDYFGPLREIGATDFNGTTWLDRTNYFQTVPKAALEAALFLESDRMGHLLGAVTQEKLDNQIGVVSNEKRQGDNQPYGLVDYRQSELLFPKGHPYHHSTIGSLADLEAATLEDMHQWFKDHYGPNNAILVLAGDIDSAEAKPLVEKWFGAIPAGPAVPAIDPPLPTLDKPVFETMFDRVASPRIYRNWVVPGLNDPDYADLNVAMTVLGGLSSSRLDNILVRDEQLAVAVSAYTLPFTHGSIVQIQADAGPGISVKTLEARLDQLIQWFIDTGPTADEVQRVATRQAASTIGGLEQVGGFGGKAVALAEGELYSDNPAHYKTELERLAAATPDSVRAAMQKWLTRPVVGITVLPGERPAYDDASGQVAGGATPGGFGPARYLDDAETEAAGRSAAVDRSAGLPPVGFVPNVDFPAVETITLSNGVPVHFAYRDAVPMASVLLSFDAGIASDRADKPGLHNFTLAMLEQGTTSLTAAQIAENEERLGANIFTSSDNDRTSVGVRALTANLGASLDLLADIVKNPAFAQNDIDRVRAQTLTAIDAETNDPGTVSLNTIMQEIYGAAHPYGRSATGSGTAQAVAAITREDLSAYHNGWIRPEKMAIYAIGKVDRDALVTQLEARFGSWRGNGEAAPAKAFDAALPEQQGRVIVLHRPNSPQSFIRAAQVLPQSGKDDLLHLDIANDILGGNFLSRINLDLRETKGWSYGARSSLGRNANNVAWVVRAPVQTNQTGPSVAAIQQQVRDFLGDKGVTTDELEGTRSGNIRELPGQFETSNAVLGQMQADMLYGRPANYAETVADRYRAMSAADLNAAMAAAVDPDKLTWVIVGDADQIRGQLDALGMPVEYRDYAPAISDVSKASESGSAAE